MKGISEKHEDGEFLKEIVLKNPHLYNKAQKLLASYCDLIITMGDIVKLNMECEKAAAAKFDKWIIDLIKHKSIENSLYHDCHFIDLGDIYS